MWLANTGVNLTRGMSNYLMHIRNQLVCQRAIFFNSFFYFIRIVKFIHNTSTRCIIICIHNIVKVYRFRSMSTPDPFIVWQINTYRSCRGSISRFNNYINYLSTNSCYLLFLVFRQNRTVVFKPLRLITNGLNSFS